LGSMLGCAGYGVHPRRRATFPGPSGGWPATVPEALDDGGPRPD
jgi:hypothetical protein